MTTDRERIIEERKRLRSEYRELYDRVSSLLFRHDPIQINFEKNTDEYDPEVGTIIPRLRDCASCEDVMRVVHEEFVRWFDQDTAGSADQYEAISEEIWQHWLEFQQAEAVPPNGSSADSSHPISPSITPAGGL